MISFRIKLDFLLKDIGEYFLYNGVLVSSVQQNESALRISKKRGIYVHAKLDLKLVPNFYQHYIMFWCLSISVIRINSTFCCSLNLLPEHCTLILLVVLVNACGSILLSVFRFRVGVHCPPSEGQMALGLAEGSESDRKLCVASWSWKGQLRFLHVLPALAPDGRRCLSKSLRPSSGQSPATNPSGTRS